jgi:Caspase domain/Domain of unknown function (DUF4384)
LSKNALVLFLKTKIVMSQLKRRHFLQLAGSTIATLGFSHLDIVRRGNLYAQVLAQNTPRKLALLVGINQYPASQRFDNLKGCVTDVELQEKLLTYRFGFNPRDIIKLTTDESPDKQPTRNNILTAFEEHLIKQAKPGDVVVFHFSGHGSRLPELNPTVRACRKDDYNSTLVTADDGKNNFAQDIMGKTLFLLMSALNTENVTVVLDSCYSGGGTRGNFRIRSVSGDGLNPSPEEIAYQQSWMERLQLSETELARRRCAGVAKGVAIASAQPDEKAKDAYFDGFHAGAFTYLLTQYLWQQTNTVGSAIAQISHSIKSSYSQVPLVDGNNNQPVYFIGKKSLPSDAVITAVNRNRATLWLGGLDKESLAAFQSNAGFAILNNDGQTVGEVKLATRSGLIGETTELPSGLHASLQPGMLLQESSRVVPGGLKLRIGIDASIAADIEVAKRVISAINRVEVVPAQPGNVPYPGGVQYILSRMTGNYQQLLQQQIVNLPAIGSIGLFTPGLELVPQSFGEPGETVKVAFERLEIKLKSFLATYILKQTLNANSSEVSVEVSLNLLEQPNQPIAHVSTGQARNNRRELEPTYLNKLPLNKLFQFRVTNRDSSNLYFTIILIDSTGSLVVAFPYDWPLSNESMQLKAGQTILVGNQQELRLKAIEPGTGKALIIFSRSPLKNTVKALQFIAEEQNQTSRAVAINRGQLDVIGNLLDDLSSDRSANIAGNTRSVSVSEMATLAIAFEVGNFN